MHVFLVSVSDTFVSEKGLICITPATISFKDGVYFCYCAYVLRISRYSGFLWVVPTNAGIFLHSLKLCEESIT